MGFPASSDGKESVCSAGDQGLIPGSGRKEWLSTGAFLPGESHRQRSLVVYSPWGCKELDTTEQLNFILRGAGKISPLQAKETEAVMELEPGFKPSTVYHTL